MIFIIDSGSTKCDWIAIDSKTGDQLFDKQRTKGLNPAIISETEAFEHVAEHGDPEHLLLISGPRRNPPLTRLVQAIISAEDQPSG